MSDLRQESALVVKLSQLMLRKLEINRHKPDWMLEDVGNLIGKLMDEVEELIDAVAACEVLGNSSHRDIEVWNEAADVANMAAMVANVTTGQTFTGGTK